VRRTRYSKLSDKQCATDPLPTRLLKDNANVLAPFIIRSVCVSDAVQGSIHHPVTE